MRSKYSVKLKTIAEEMNAQGLRTPRNAKFSVNMLNKMLKNRAYIGEYHHGDIVVYFDPHRLQIMGRVESTYLDTLSHEERLAAFKRFMQYDISCLVICHGMQPFPECLEMAEKFDRNVFMTSEDTSEFQADVISTLHNYLAPRITTHGVPPSTAF